VTCAVKVDAPVRIDHEVTKPSVAGESEASREAKAEVEQACRCGRCLPAAMLDQPIQSAVEIWPSTPGDFKQFRLVDGIVERLHLYDEKCGSAARN